MKKLTCLLLLASFIVSTMLPVDLAAASLFINPTSVAAGDPDRQQEIAELLTAINKIRQAKGLPDDIRAESLNDLLRKLNPLLSEEIGYLTGQREAFLSNETDQTAKDALRKSFDKNIDRLKNLQTNYSLESLLGSSEKTVSGTPVKAGKGADSDGDYVPANITGFAQHINIADPNISPENIPKNNLNKEAVNSTKLKGPLPQAASTPPVQITIDDVPEIGDSSVTVRIHNIGANAVPSPRLVIAVAGNGTQMTLAARDLSTSNNNELVISDQFSQRLQALNVVTYKIVGKNAANADIEITSLNVKVFPKVDATDSGLFGLLYAGVVTSRQAQTANEAAPFMGFQVGWGSRVTGLRNLRPASELEPSSACLGSPDLAAGAMWQVEFNDLKAPSGAIYQRVDDGDFNVNNNFYRSVGSGQTCEVKFKRGFHPFTGRGTSRWSFRFQGTFSNEGRVAIATPTETPLPAGQPNRPFPFINHRESFSPEVTVWREWNPLGQFSVGVYGTIGGTTVLDSNTVEDQLITDRETNFRIKSKINSDGGTKFYGELGSIQHLKFDPGKFLLQNFAGFGYYEAYRGTKYKFGSCLVVTDPCQRDGKTRFRFVDKLRVFPEGLSVDFGRQITATPMFGVDLNVGAGPDNIRFFTGFAIKLKAFDGKSVEDK